MKLYQGTTISIERVIRKDTARRRTKVAVVITESTVSFFGSKGEEINRVFTHKTIKKIVENSTSTCLKVKCRTLYLGIWRFK